MIWFRCPSLLDEWIHIDNRLGCRGSTQDLKLMLIQAQDVTFRSGQRNQHFLAAAFCKPCCVPFSTLSLIVGFSTISVHTLLLSFVLTWVSRHSDAIYQARTSKTQAKDPWRSLLVRTQGTDPPSPLGLHPISHSNVPIGPRPRGRRRHIHHSVFRG